MSHPATPRPTAVRLDGDALRTTVVNKVRTTIDAHGPHREVVLATVLAGDDPSSRIYVQSKHDHADQAGITTRLVVIENGDHVALEAAVSDLVSDDGVDGILVQLPLPTGISPQPLLDLLVPAKDVDGLSSRSLGLLMGGQPGFAPCRALAVTRFIERYDITTAGRRAVVVGATAADALAPLALLAHERWGLSTTLVHASDPDLATVCRQADILVSVANRPGLIGAAHVKPGAAVFDLGINGTALGIPGDVRASEVSEIAGWLTPTPGGIGAATIACLLDNTLRAARQRQGW